MLHPTERIANNIDGGPYYYIKSSWRFRKPSKPNGHVNLNEVIKIQNENDWKPKRLKTK